MVSFIDARRAQCGVEPICEQLPIAPSVYYEAKARQADRSLLPARSRRDAELAGEIERIRKGYFRVYGARKVWRQLWRENIFAARCTIERLMRRIIGWRVARSMHSELVLDALEQAIWSRCPPKGVIRHSDHGSQYLAIRYSDRLTEIGVEPSTGSVGGSYDNALAETIIGLYKTEVIHHRSLWRNLDEVEYATLEWLDWFNNRRLLEPIGNVPPAERETQYLRRKPSQPSRPDSNQEASGIPGAVRNAARKIPGTICTVAMLPSREARVGPRPIRPAC